MSNYSKFECSLITGLVICQEAPIFATTPDGLVVTDTGEILTIEGTIHLLRKQRTGWLGSEVVNFCLLSEHKPCLHGGRGWLGGSEKVQKPVYMINEWS